MERKATGVRCTSREKVYNFIVEFMEKNGYSPSVREICIGTNLNSIVSVCNHLLKLKMMGKLT